MEDPSIEITVDNYEAILTDIMGLRALHLFKKDWELIHSFINNSWDIIGKPIVNIREGDNPVQVNKFKEMGCEVFCHPFGYRSVHYIVSSKPSKKECQAEIQVRTIFEEGWSEIDHLMRYPYVRDNPILEQYLVMFNRLAGSADEMASYLLFLNETIHKKELEYSKVIEEKSKKNEELQETIRSLKAKIEKIKMDQEDKAYLRSGLGTVADIISSFQIPTSLPSSIGALLNNGQELSNRLSISPGFSNLLSGSWNNPNQFNPNSILIDPGNVALKKFGEINSVIDSEGSVNRKTSNTDK